MLMTALLAHLVVLTPECPAPEMWLAGEGRASTRTRQETRRRMARTWEALGVDEASRTVLDAVVLRESSGDPCAVHRLGPDEDGLGPGGLQVRLHLAKWDRGADPRVLHVPEVSAVVMVRLFRRIRDRYRARTWLRAGQIYGGRIRPEDQDPWLDQQWCTRLAKRGIDCQAAIGELGDALGLGPTPEQYPVVARLQARSERR
jgi:hypothetical protein